MSKFLFTVWPLTGHIHPNLAIAKQLQERGHTVAFFTGGRARTSVENAGFRFFAFEKLDESIIDRVVLGSNGILSATGRPSNLRRHWRDWLLGTAPQQVEDITKIVDSWAPDAIVCDPTMWAPMLILHEKLRIPVAVYSLVPACHLPGPEGPVLGFPLPKTSNGLGRLRSAFLRNLSYVFLTPVRREASALRKRYGLPALEGSVTDLTGSMPLYLVPGSPEFDYDRRDLPKSVHYVGCCNWKPPGPDELPAWINQLPADQPLVYASEGTVQLDSQLLRAVAQGLGNLPVQVILTTGRHRDPATLDLGPRPLASNIHIAQWVPLNPLLKQLGAVVTIGGPSTLMPCLEVGVPVVIVPFSWDHPETAWRIDRSRCGIRVAPKECTPERIRDALMQILSQSRYREGARRVADSFRRCGGAAEAARLIESLAPESRSAKPVSPAVLQSPGPMR